MSEALAVTPPSSALAPMNVKDLLAQVSLIQEVMKTVMQEGQHYGKVPGCGDKPSLLKPGAEKLGFVFRLAPTFEIEERDQSGGHREYRVTCRLNAIGSNVFIGAGLGVGSTMEAKYRFRTGPKKPTGREVPKAYWDLRRSDPSKAQEMLGGKGFGVAKNEAALWEVVEVGERVEHDNPADYYNTVLKMAKKRAQVDAILTATAASDIFTQDIEDIAANQKAYDVDVTATPASGTNGHVAAQPPAAAVQRTQQHEAEGQASSPQQHDAGHSGDWRDHPIPKFIKKYAGQTLGQMDPKDLAWWAQNYQPKGFGGKPPSEADFAFKAALQAALQEMREHAGETAKKVSDRLAPAGDVPAEDVPY